MQYIYFGTPTHTQNSMTVSKSMQYILWLSLLAFGVIVSSLHPVFINLGKVNGKIPFSSASVAFLIELFKLIISAGLALRDFMSNRELNLPSPHIIFLYSLPAILYTVNNNLITHIQLYMDPSSFQLLNNLKIAATAIFYYLLINRNVTRRKWFAVFLLFIAGVVNSIGGLQSDGAKNTLYITVTGLYLVIIYCAMSGLAGVYTESVLKKFKKTSIHSQNMTLYTFGIILNGMTFLYSASSNDIYTGFLDGFSVWTWTIVITQALNGIIISLVLKHASNITRLFMIGASMVLTSVFSYFIFGFNINFYFFISFLIVMMALCLYHEFQTDITAKLNGKH